MKICSITLICLQEKDIKWAIFVWSWETLSNKSIISRSAQLRMWIRLRVSPGCSWFCRSSPDCHNCGQFLRRFEWSVFLSLSFSLSFAPAPGCLFRWNVGLEGHKLWCANLQLAECKCKWRHASVSVRVCVCQCECVSASARWVADLHNP